MARRLSNWLQAYQEYTEGTEPPPIFHLWVALGAIAGAAQRKLYMNADYFHIHSNMYVILVGPPGTRKSTALRIGKGILKRVPDYGLEVYFSTQASSVAALVKQLSSIKTKEHQSMTAFSSELGSLLGTKSVEMTDFLVDIYDCEPDWDKQTISRSLEKIERPWFNLIGATTPQWMGDNLSRTAMEGGFVARTIFVYEDKIARRVAFPKLTEEQKAIQKHLVHDLAQIAGLKGEFDFTPEGREYYRSWYEDTDRAKAIADYRLSGYYERKHIQVLKVAMLLSLAKGDTKLLTPDDIGQAIDLLEDIEPGMMRAFSMVGKNLYSTDLERIKLQIHEHKKLQYKQIVSANIHAVEKDQIDKILSTLCDMGETRRSGLFYLSNRGGTNGAKPAADGSADTGSGSDEATREHTGTT